jgi:hypothetical protein
MDLWSDHCPTKARELWGHSVRVFEGRMDTLADLAELLLRLQYDVVLGPMLGVPEARKFPFLRWLIDGIRGST